VAAVDAAAEECTHEHPVSPCGFESPFWKLIRNKGSVVLPGVSLNSNREATLDSNSPATFIWKGRASSR
jgi:hypothetical protein